VVFEGGEGSGKSTQVELLAQALGRDGYHVVVTREPGATEVGVRIRSLLLDRTSGPADAVILAPRAEALLYAADRAHHVASVVRPALAHGSIVVSDRYIDSSLAYQGGGRTLPVDEVSWLSAWATGGLAPDLVVLLDIDPVVGLARAAGRGAADRLEAENVSFHERVRYAFLDLAGKDPKRYLIVDATASPETIARQVLDRVGVLLPAPHHRDDVAGPTPPDGEAPVSTTAGASDAAASGDPGVILAPQWRMDGHGPNANGASNGSVADATSTRYGADGSAGAR